MLSLINANVRCLLFQKALRRLGGGKDTKKKLSWAEKKKAKAAALAAEESHPELKRNRLEMEAITAIADKMMSFGAFSAFSGWEQRAERIPLTFSFSRTIFQDVYEDTYQQIMRRLRIEEAIGKLASVGFFKVQRLTSIDRSHCVTSRRVLGASERTTKWGFKRSYS